MNPRKILVTAALPYANGDIHLGLMLEAVQTDIWVRLQRMRGNDCVFVCADDAHGTAIMLSAESRGICTGTTKTTTNSPTIGAGTPQNKTKGQAHTTLRPMGERVQHNHEMQKDANKQ